MTQQQNQPQQVAAADLLAEVIAEQQLKIRNLNTQLNKLDQVVQAYYNKYGALEIPGGVSVTGPDDAKSGDQVIGGDQPVSEEAVS